MRSLLKTRFPVMLTTLIMLTVVALPVEVSIVSPNIAYASARTFPAKGGLDCNGFSAIQQPLAPYLYCADFADLDGGGRGYDNGHYIGHDEPTMQFLSSTPGSANDLQWRISLPKEHALPATQTFENQATFWFNIALCDPHSYPQNSCIPDSDSNPPAQFFADPRVAGGAILELQFYPPGSALRSCDTTHWCAALTIDSLECIPGSTGVTCNRNCTEPVNFAYIQMDGVPAGPPGPASQTIATFTPNAETLLMNQGDKIDITIKDTPNGMINRIVDRSTGKTGFMVASAANGFENLDPNTCAPTNFSFHPEYSTAKFGNFLSWGPWQATVGLAVEIGHFTPGANGDNDKDDPPCVSGPVVPGCYNFAQGGDRDFDGTSYLPDWPDGTANAATPVTIRSVLGNGIGPVSRSPGSGSYNHGYPTFQFETDVLGSESTCTPSGAGCTVPPPGAIFYPFYAQSNFGAQCVFTFGNDIRGGTVNDFGRDVQYGPSNLSWIFVGTSGGVQPNPCTPRK